MVGGEVWAFSEEDQVDSPHSQLPDTAKMAAEGFDGVGTARLERH